MTDHTNAVAIEIARLLSNGKQEGELIPALAPLFPYLTAAEIGEDVALPADRALQNLVAAEIAESERALAQLKAQLPKHKKSVACLPH